MSNVATKNTYFYIELYEEYLNRAYISLTVQFLKVIHTNIWWKFWD